LVMGKKGPAAREAQAAAKEKLKKKRPFTSTEGGEGYRGGKEGGGKLMH